MNNRILHHNRHTTDAAVIPEPKMTGAGTGSYAFRDSGDIMKIKFTGDL
jgi:hypothetical protein